MTRRICTSSTGEAGSPRIWTQTAARPLAAGRVGPEALADVDGFLELAVAGEEDGQPDLVGRVWRSAGGSSAARR